MQRMKACTAIEELYVADVRGSIRLAVHLNTNVGFQFSSFLFFILDVVRRDLASQMK